MYDHVVVDVEIQKTIEETPGGWEATDKLGVAVACVWQYQDQRMCIYGPDDVEELRRRLLQADRITGYNIWNFDFPVIWGMSKEQWKNDLALGDAKHPRLSLRPQTDDLLRRIWRADGINPDGPNKRGGYKLDDIAGATLNAGKIGYGGDAPKWYQEGKVQKVANYCADDVALERDLCDFIGKYGYVLRSVHPDRFGEVSVIKVPPWDGTA